MADECGFDGDPDLYGLGIRISLYIQLLTMCLIPLLGIPKYSRFFTSTGLCLFAATWIVIIKESAARTTKGVELYFFSWLNLSQIVVVSILPMASFNFRQMANPKNMANINLAMSIILALITSYYTWFFWKGLDVLDRSGCENDYAFFFSKAPVYGWLRTLQKVIWTIALIAAGIQALMAPYNYFMMRKFRDFPQAEDILQDADPDVQVMFTGFVKQVKFQFSVMLLFGSVFMITFVALSAELPIMWNNIREVNSLKPVGQLVPFIVAIGQLLNVVYQTMKRFAGGTVDDDDDDSMDDDIGPCPLKGGDEDQQGVEMTENMAALRKSSSSSMERVAVAL